MLSATRKGEKAGMDREHTLIDVEAELIGMKTPVDQLSEIVGSA